MFKRFLAILSLICLVPVAAQAVSWSLNTWAKSAGGSIVVRDGVPQTSLNGSVFKTYTTSQQFTVTVNPNTGYTTTQVDYNGVVTSNPTQTSYMVQGPNAQKVYATFAAQPLTVTATVNGVGGTASPASLAGIYYGTKLTSAKTFTYTPFPATSAVASITGIPDGLTASRALPAPAGASVSVILPIGFTFTSNVALVGSFSGPAVAKTGPQQVVIPGTLTTLDGSSSTGVISSYLWTQTAGPGFPLTRVIADNTPGAKVTFTPTAVGEYTFTLMVTGGSTATTKVTVTNDIVAVVRNECYSCHLGNGIGIASNVFGNWSSSGHKAKGLMCSQCHVGTNSGGHPGNLIGGTVSEATFDFTSPFYGTGNFCVTCHDPVVVTDFAASRHSVAAGSASCGFCHTTGVHNPKAACTNCHVTGNTLGLTWPPTGYEFHSSFDGGSIKCTNCHKTHNPKQFSFSNCK